MALAGAVAIAKVLKTRADDEELHEMLAPAVSELVSTRKDGARIKDPFPKRKVKWLKHQKLIILKFVKQIYFSKKVSQ